MSHLINDLKNRENEIDLWMVDVSKFKDLEDELFEILTEGEKKRAEGFVFPHLKTRYSITHGILRKLLADYTSKSPEEVRYGYGVHGKPHLAENPLELHFNLSDSDDISIIGISLADEIGVDIEKMKPEILEKGLEKSVFTSEEQELFQRVNNQLESFYCGWTHKEARMKLSGMGMYQDPNSLKVPLHPAEDVVEVEGDYLRSFYLDSSYYVAVASKKSDFKINLVTYQYGI